MFAVLQEHLDVAEILIANGANVNATASEGESVLLAASSSGNCDIVRLLIENGAEIDQKSESGLNALTTAATLGHKEVVEVLIEHGVDVSAKYGAFSALAIAKSAGHTEVARLLQQAGASRTEIPPKVSSEKIADKRKVGFRINLDLGADEYAWFERVSATLKTAFKVVKARSSQNTEPDYELRPCKQNRV